MAKRRACTNHAIGRAYALGAVRADSPGDLTAPYGLKQVDAVEDQCERLVVDGPLPLPRRNKDDHGDGLGRECSDYGERRCTLGKGETGLEVLDMSGPQHAARMA